MSACRTVAYLLCHASLLVYKLPGEHTRHKHYVPKHKFNFAQMYTCAYYYLTHTPTHTHLWVTHPRSPALVFFHNQDPSIRCQPPTRPVMSSHIDNTDTHANIATFSMAISLYALSYYYTFALVVRFTRPGGAA